VPPISISMNFDPVRRATSCHASRVIGKGFTESAITKWPRRRLSVAMA
jgi:hypothetical protein